MTYSTITDDDVEQLRFRLEQLEEELQVRQSRLATQLHLASKVHASLLPTPVRHEKISVDVRYLPVEEVGGDYCQVQFADPDTCYVTMCDVTGHGIGAALMATRVSSEVRYSIINGRAPREITRSLNRFVCDHFSEANLYLTFVVAQIDLWKPQITWCGAGHPSPLLIRRGDKTVHELTSQNSMIGIMEDCLSKDSEHTLPLDHGDRLVFYTDGLTETADVRGRCLGTEGLSKIAVEAASVDLFGAADVIVDRVAQYQHGPVTDDKTLIVMEIK